MLGCFNTCFRGWIKALLFLYMHECFIFVCVCILKSVWREIVLLLYPLQCKSRSARENCKGTVPSVYLSVWGGKKDCPSSRLYRQTHERDEHHLSQSAKKLLSLFSPSLSNPLSFFTLFLSPSLSRVNEREVAMLEVYNDSVLQKHKSSSCELMPHHFRQTALNKGPALHSPRLTKRSAVKPWMQLKNRRERGWC